MSEIAGLEDYVLTVKANSFEKLLAYGTGFYIASPDNAKITVETPEGGRFSCGVGEGARHLNPFQHLIVRNNENYDQQIKLKIGYGEFIASTGGGSGSVGSLVGAGEDLWGTNGLITPSSPLIVPANEARLMAYITLMMPASDTYYQVLAMGHAYPVIEGLLGVGEVLNIELPANNMFLVVCGADTYCRAGELLK